MAEGEGVEPPSPILRDRQFSRLLSLPDAQSFQDGGEYRSRTYCTLAGTQLSRLLHYRPAHSPLFLATYCNLLSVIDCCAYGALTAFGPCLRDVLNRRNVLLWVYLH